ncbi:hypothetical protein BLOT_006213 [Blomia tropicalis]|nr:hypothetical protein BLOT_006213 [Blomia tropicalis]
MCNTINVQLALRCGVLITLHIVKGPLWYSNIKVEEYTASFKYLSQTVSRLEVLRLFPSSKTQ